MSRTGAYGSQLAGERLDWMDRGACADPSLSQAQRDAYFWDDARSARHRQGALEARLRCRECDVQVLCLEYALKIPRPHGIWGGLDLDERMVLVRSRGKQAG